MELRPPQVQKSHTQSFPHCERNTVYHDLIIFTNLDFPGYGSAIVNASPTIAKKRHDFHVRGTWFSQCGRFTNSAPPTSWKNTTACLVQANKSYRQRGSHPVALTASNLMASFRTGFLHRQAGSNRSSIEARSRSERTTHPFSPNEKPSSMRNPTAASRTQQQEEASSSMQNTAADRKQQAEDSSRQNAAGRTQQAEDSDSSTGQNPAAAAAAAAAAGRIQQEEERYCRSTGSQPERRVWHSQVWNYRTVQVHV